MSVYSRWVDDLGTTSIESTPARRQASYPVSRSRIGSGPAGLGCGLSELPPERNHGETVKPYSDCTASAGTVGTLPVPSSAPLDPGPVSLSRATTVATRSSVPCTYDAAAAPTECPTIAIRVVRPGVNGSGSGERSKNRRN